MERITKDMLVTYIKSGRFFLFGLPTILVHLAMFACCFAYFLNTVGLIEIPQRPVIAVIGAIIIINVLYYLSFKGKCEALGIRSDILLAPVGLALVLFVLELLDAVPRLIFFK